MLELKAAGLEYVGSSVGERAGIRGFQAKERAYGRARGKGKLHPQGSQRQATVFRAQGSRGTGIRKW